MANLVTATVGLLDSVTLVGPLHRPMLAVDVLARCAHGVSGDAVSWAVADALIAGRPAPPSLASPVSPALAAEPAAGSATRPPRALALSRASSPVAGTVWPSPPTPRQPPRRCSRLAQGRYVSIVDKAVARKQSMDEGAFVAARRQGELSADDLLAVAVEEGLPLPDADVAVLAKACDIPISCLGLSASPVLVDAASP